MQINKKNSLIPCEFKLLGFKLHFFKMVLLIKPLFLLFPIFFLLSYDKPLVYIY